jgi:FkbM family methyltransferase
MRHCNLDSTIKYFVDNNPLKQGTDLNGIKILSCDEAFANYNDEVVLITCGEGDEIIRQLKSYNVPEEKIFIPDISAIDETDSDFFNKHINLLDDFYDALGDDKSRKVLAGIMNYKMTHDMKYISEIADNAEEQYFDDELIHYTEEDIFLDCGGYTGDTVEAYVKYNGGKYKKVICMEADRDNCNIIRGKADNFKLQIEEKACWSEKCKLTFDKVGSGSGHVMVDGKPLKETVSVEADTIDNIAGKDKIAFIKMDIEGAEYDALMGARRVIERDKPTLMISVYHKQDDLLRIPALILSMNYDYKFYLRHYRSMSVQETVLYAVR